MKNIVITASAIVLDVICGITCLFCLERVDVGNVGVIYTANGVEDKTLPAKIWGAKNSAPFPSMTVVFGGD